MYLHFSIWLTRWLVSAYLYFPKTVHSRLFGVLRQLFFSYKIGCGQKYRKIKSFEQLFIFFFCLFRNKAVAVLLVIEIFFVRFDSRPIPFAFEKCFKYICRSFRLMSFRAISSAYDKFDSTWPTVEKHKFCVCYVDVNTHPTFMCDVGYERLILVAVRCLQMSSMSAEFTRKYGKLGFYIHSARRIITVLSL